MEENIVVLRDARKAWVSTASRFNALNEIFIFSPYITGDVLDEIIRNADNKTVNIVTSLKAQSVISKSLDIDLLKRLVIEGAKVFSHPNLHAKILINGGNAVIGSQNFTTKGSYNAETSVQMVFDKKNQNEMNQFINDVLAESTFVTLNLLSEFNNQCNKFSEELLQLNNTLNKIDKIIETESNSEKTKRQPKTKSRCKNKKFLKASIKRKNWKSAGAEGWYDTISISREDEGLIALAEASGADVKKGQTILIFDTNTRNLIFGEIHNFQISKLCQFGFASARELGDHIGNQSILTNHPNEGPNRANFHIMGNLSFDESGEETWQKDFFRFDGSSIDYVESISVQGEPVDPESTNNSRAHSDQILFNSRSWIYSGDDELTRPQPFSRHFEVGRKLEVWFELFLGNKPVLFLSTLKNG